MSDASWCDICPPLSVFPLISLDHQLADMGEDGYLVLWPFLRNYRGGASLSGLSLKTKAVSLAVLVPLGLVLACLGDCQGFGYKTLAMVPSSNFLPFCGPRPRSEKIQI